MNREQPRHYAVLKAQNEVRHLVLEFVSGTAETKLVQLSDGLESTLATGTQAEVSDKADELMIAWQNEGFQCQQLDQQHLVFETLRAVIALAQKMGFRTIYDQKRYRNLDLRRGPINATGEVPLATWPGLTTKSGGAYEYAFDGMHLYCQPTLPGSAERDLAIGDSNLDFLKKFMELRNEQGPVEELLLGGCF